jgi:hypothetical protein
MFLIEKKNVDFFPFPHEPVAPTNVFMGAFIHLDPNDHFFELVVLFDYEIDSRAKLIAKEIKKYSENYLKDITFELKYFARNISSKDPLFSLSSLRALHFSSKDARKVFDILRSSQVISDTTQMKVDPDIQKLEHFSIKTC